MSLTATVYAIEKALRLVSREKVLYAVDPSNPEPFDAGAWDLTVSKGDRTEVFTIWPGTTNLGYPYYRIHRAVNGTVVEAYAFKCDGVTARASRASAALNRHFGWLAWPTDSSETVANVNYTLTRR